MDRIAALKSLVNKTTFILNNELDEQQRRNGSGGKVKTKQ